jgi:hypothetical protein
LLSSVVFGFSAPIAKVIRAHACQGIDFASSLTKALLDPASTPLSALIRLIARTLDRQ